MTTPVNHPLARRARELAAHPFYGHHGWGDIRHLLLDLADEVERLDAECQRSCELAARVEQLQSLNVLLAERVVKLSCKVGRGRDLPPEGE